MRWKIEVFHDPEIGLQGGRLKTPDRGATCQSNGGLLHSDLARPLAHHAQSHRPRRVTEARIDGHRDRVARSTHQRRLTIDDVALEPLHFILPNVHDWVATWPGRAIRRLEMLSSGAASRDSQISNSAPKSQRLEMWVIESRRRPRGRLDARPASKRFRILFINLNELDETLDAEVGERLNAVFANAKHPNGAVLDLHFVGDISYPIFIFAEVFRDLGDGRDVMDLVDVGGHAARASIADDAGVQFQGSSSCRLEHAVFIRKHSLSF